VSDYTNKPAINQKSKRIANSKKTSNISVHNRLHQQALSKQKIEKREANDSSFSTEKRFDVSDLNPTEKKSKGRHRKGKSMNSHHRIPLNYGTRLYQKGIQKIEDVERKHQQALVLREFDEVKDLSFHPKINPVSYYYGAKQNEKLEDYLLNKGLMTKDKLDQKRAETMYERQQNCTFQPKININSRKIADQRDNFYEGDIEQENNSSSTQDQFLHLYDDAMKRIERHNQIYSMWIDSECTFQPDIENSRKNVAHRYNKSNNNFADKSMLERFNHENFDQVTGQQLYKPKVGRGPIDKKHRSSKSIGNLLYGVKNLYQENKQKRIQNYEAELKEQMNQKHCKKSSEALLNKMKNKRFAWLFELLDSNGDGLISAQQINISQLTSEVLEIMTPLFWEMEEMSQTLDQNEFIEATKMLYNTLSVHDKNKLIAINHKWEVEKEYCRIGPSFEPTINKKSSFLAQKNRNPNERIEDALVRKKVENEDKLHKIRRQKYREETRGCTFHPQLYDSQAEQRSVFQNLTQQDANVENYRTAGIQYNAIEEYIPARSESDSESCFDQPISDNIQ